VANQPHDRGVLLIPVVLNIGFVVVESPAKAIFDFLA
jgi:hypothetical protein